MPTTALLIPWFITRLASSLESIGDITATAALSGKKTDGAKFQQRLRGGLTMDALSGLFAACCGGLPLTTLSQNNGLISQVSVHAIILSRSGSLALSLSGSLALARALSLPPWLVIA